MKKKEPDASFGTELASFSPKWLIFRFKSCPHLCSATVAPSQREATAAVGLQMLQFSESEKEKFSADVTTLLINKHSSIIQSNERSSQ